MFLKAQDCKPLAQECEIATMHETQANL